MAMQFRKSGKNIFSGGKRGKMSAAQRKAIGIALAKVKGDTTDYDPYEAKGRKPGKGKGAGKGAGTPKKATKPAKGRRTTAQQNLEAAALERQKQTEARHRSFTRYQDQHITDRLAELDKLEKTITEGNTKNPLNTRKRKILLDEIAGDRQALQAEQAKRKERLNNLEGLSEEERDARIQKAEAAYRKTDPTHPYNAQNLDEALTNQIRAAAAALTDEEITEALQDPDLANHERAELELENERRNPWQPGGLLDQALTDMSMRDLNQLQNYLGSTIQLPKEDLYKAAAKAGNFRYARKDPEVQAAYQQWLKNQFGDKAHLLDGLDQTQLNNPIIAQKLPQDVKDAISEIGYLPSFANFVRTNLRGEEPRSVNPFASKKNKTSKIGSDVNAGKTNKDKQLEDLRQDWVTSVDENTAAKKRYIDARNKYTAEPTKENLEQAHKTELEQHEANRRQRLRAREAGIETTNDLSEEEHLKQRQDILNRHKDELEQFNNTQQPEPTPEATPETDKQPNAYGLTDGVTFNANRITRPDGSDVRGDVKPVYLDEGKRKGTYDKDGRAAQIIEDSKGNNVLIVAKNDTELNKHINDFTNGRGEYFEEHTKENNIAPDYGLKLKDWAKGNKNRTYIDNWGNAVGLEVTKHKTGNVKSAFLDGKKLANNRAQYLLSGKIWIDNNTNELHIATGSDDLPTEQIREQLTPKLEALTGKTLTAPKTATPIKRLVQPGDDITPNIKDWTPTRGKDAGKTRHYVNNAVDLLRAREEYRDGNLIEAAELSKAWFDETGTIRISDKGRIREEFDDSDYYGFGGQANLKQRLARALEDILEEKGVLPTPDTNDNKEQQPAGEADREREHQKFWEAEIKDAVEAEKAASEKEKAFQKAKKEYQDAVEANPSGDHSELAQKAENERLAAIKQYEEAAYQAGSVDPHAAPEGAFIPNAATNDNMAGWLEDEGDFTKKEANRAKPQPAKTTPKPAGKQATKPQLTEVANDDGTYTIDTTGAPRKATQGFKPEAKATTTDTEPLKFTRNDLTAGTKPQNDYTATTTQPRDVADTLTHLLTAVPTDRSELELLKGIHFTRTDNGELQASATDRFQLHTDILGSDQITIDEELGDLLLVAKQKPGRDIASALKTLKGTSGTLNITKGEEEGTVKLERGGKTATVEINPEEYVRLAKLLQTDENERINATLNRADFLNIAKQAKYDTDVDNSLQLETKGSSLHATWRDKDGDLHTAQLPINIQAGKNRKDTNTDQRWVIDAKRLVDLLSGANDKDVKLSLEEADLPLFIDSDSTRKNVLMPLRIRGEDGTIPDTAKAEKRRKLRAEFNKELANRSEVDSKQFYDAVQKAREYVNKDGEKGKYTNVAIMFSGGKMFVAMDKDLHRSGVVDVQYPESWENKAALLEASAIQRDGRLAIGFGDNQIRVYSDTKGLKASAYPLVDTPKNRNLIEQVRDHHNSGGTTPAPEPQKTTGSKTAAEDTTPAKLTQEEAALKVKEARSAQSKATRALTRKDKFTKNAQKQSAVAKYDSTTGLVKSVPQAQETLGELGTVKDVTDVGNAPKMYAAVNHLMNSDPQLAEQELDNLVKRFAEDLFNGKEDRFNTGEKVTKDYTRGNYTFPSEAHETAAINLAEELTDKLTQLEPEATENILKAIKANNGTPVMLQFRQKTTDSIVSKLNRNAIEDYGANYAVKTLQEAVHGIRDGLRYTAVFPDENYTQGVDNIVQYMQKAGFELKKPTNHTFGNYTWKNYPGLNLVFEKDGNSVELQVQTPYSAVSKQITHVTYETLRELPDSDTNFTRIDGDQARIFSMVPTPEGVNNPYDRGERKTSWQSTTPVVTQSFGTMGKNSGVSTTRNLGAGSVPTGRGTPTVQPDKTRSTTSPKNKPSPSSTNDSATTTASKTAGKKPTLKEIRTDTKEFLAWAKERNSVADRLNDAMRLGKWDSAESWIDSYIAERAEYFQRAGEIAEKLKRNGGGVEKLKLPYADRFHGHAIELAMDEEKVQQHLDEDRARMLGKLAETKELITNAKTLRDNAQKPTESPESIARKYGEVKTPEQLDALENELIGYDRDSLVEVLNKSGIVRQEFGYQKADSFVNMVASALRKQGYAQNRGLWTSSPTYNAVYGEQQLDAQRPDIVANNAPKLVFNEDGIAEYNPDAPVQITHGGLSGTIIRGTAKGDGSNEILKSHGWKWSRNLRAWYVPRSRDNMPATHKIERTISALEEKGFKVGARIDANLDGTAGLEQETDKPNDVNFGLGEGSENVAGNVEEAMQAVDSLQDLSLAKLRKLRDEALDGVEGNGKQAKAQEPYVKELMSRGYTRNQAYKALEGKNVQSEVNKLNRTVTTDGSGNKLIRIKKDEWEEGKTVNAKRSNGSTYPVVLGDWMEQEDGFYLVAFESAAPPNVKHGTWTKHNNKWVIVVDQDKYNRDSKITVTKRNGSSEELYMGKMVAERDGVYLVQPERTPQRSGQMRRFSGWDDRGARRSDSTQSTSRSNAPASRKQKNFLNKLLLQHERDYGVSAGQHLMLDSFSVRFPTEAEIEKMTRAEVSNLIDLLKNDAM